MGIGKDFIGIDEDIPAEVAEGTEDSLGLAIFAR
jgi:hypothetical protein